mgnify:CR=1 FL=1
MLICCYMASLVAPQVDGATTVVKLNSLRHQVNRVKIIVPGGFTAPESELYSSRERRVGSSKDRCWWAISGATRRKVFQPKKKHTLCICSWPSELEYWEHGGISGTNQ